jgi:hypothetical protein
MLEWLSFFDDSINDAGKAQRSFKPLILPGIRAAVVNEEDFQIAVGAGVPIGLNREANNLAAFLYFSVEHRLF